MPNQSSQFDNILLPPAILAGLYSESLVVIERHPGKTNQHPPAQFEFRKSPVLEVSTKTLNTVEETPLIYGPISTEKISSLGDFGRYVLVLVNDPKSLYLGETELDTLGKMLQAIGISFADIAIVNTAHQPINWQNLQQQLPPKKVIMFGVEPAEIQMPVRFPHFRVQNWSNISFLYSPSLIEINRETPDQKQTKMALWTAIKELFASN